MAGRTTSSPRPSVTIGYVYPALLGTYGDGGNVVVLAQRLRWRGITVAVLPIVEGAPVPEGCDLYVLGGAEDAAGRRAAELLAVERGFRRAVLAGAPVLAVCAGLQLLGGSVHTGGDPYPGLGLLDVTTVPGARRLVGEVQVRPSLPGVDGIISGFENHRGVSTLGPDARPLGTVLVGTGNGAGVPVDGALQGGIVASYLHGPLLARNPDLADLLLRRALGGELAPLVVPEVQALRAARLGPAA